MILSDRRKTSGVTGAVTGALPPDNCLRATNRPAKIDLWLVRQSELVVLDGAVEVLGDLEAVVAVSGQVGMVQMYPLPRRRRSCGPPESSRD